MKKFAGQRLAAMVGIPVSLALLGVLALHPGQSEVPVRVSSVEIMDKYDMAVGNAVSDALDGVLAIDKVYWLDEENPVAPRPNPEKAGQTKNPGELAQILEQAQELLDLEDPLFRTDAQILPGSRISYYLDDTIFSVCWKVPVGKAVYSFAEVKIAHPSQFRRFLSDDRYGSGTQYLTSTMAQSVHAVTASAGDFYAYRPVGTTVYNGQVCRANSEKLDLCFVDSQGDLIFTRPGDLKNEADTRKFVKDRDIRFSLAFGPAMIDGGELCYPEQYPLGEPRHHFSRAALCQQGPLHYVVVTANMGYARDMPPTVAQFAKALQELGIQKAYTLDGGQTATLVSNGQVFNSVDYGDQRRISDILYFATALPESTWEEEEK